MFNVCSIVLNDVDIIDANKTKINLKTKTGVHFVKKENGGGHSKTAGEPAAVDSGRRIKIRNHTAVVYEGRHDGQYIRDGYKKKDGGTRRS